MISNNYIKYIRKDTESIYISRWIKKCDRYNPRYWKIETSNCISPDCIEKKFFVFIYVGDYFSITRHKEILPILKKYKFSKIYTSTKGHIHCYYLKRGVVFHDEYYDSRNTDKKIQSLRRLFKLLKIKTVQL